MVQRALLLACAAATTSSSTSTTDLPPASRPPRLRFRPRPCPATCLPSGSSGYFGSACFCSHRATPAPCAVPAARRADFVNKKIVSQYYRLLMKRDAAERREASEKLLAGLATFAVSKPSPERARPAPQAAQCGLLACVRGTGRQQGRRAPPMLARPNLVAPPAGSHPLTIAARHHASLFFRPCGFLCILTLHRAPTRPRSRVPFSLGSSSPS